MINQIKPSHNNVFAPFRNGNGVDYAIIKPITPTQKEEKNIEKEKKSNALGFSIATTALIAGFGVLAVMKGLPKSWYKKIDNLFKRLEKKTTKLAQSRSSSKLKSIYLSGLNGVKSLANKTKTLFNLAALKDAATNKGMQKIPLLNKFNIWITNLFEKISVKTSQRAYAKTDKRFFNLFTVCNEFNAKLPKEKVAEIASKIKDIQKTYNKNFDAASFSSRLSNTKKGFASLDQKIWDDAFSDVKKFAKDKKTYNTFKAEDFVAEQKTKLINDVNQVRNNIADKMNKEILAIYKNFLPDNDYAKIEKETHKTIKSLDKSIDLETDKLYDKLRDLKIGSAPTDALGVLTSIGVIGWGLKKADNKDERVSVALKYGIPAVGAIATSLYCTVGLVSGGTSLAVGLLSGMIINKIGVILDKSIKKYQEKPITLADLDIKSVLPTA